MVEMIVFQNSRFLFHKKSNATSSPYHLLNQNKHQTTNQNPLNNRHLHLSFLDHLVTLVHVTLQWEFLPDVQQEKVLAGTMLGNRITLRQKVLTVPLKLMLALDQMALAYLLATLTKFNLLILMKRKQHSLTSS